MPNTTADRRSAHRRVGAAAITAFLVLLLLALIHRPAQAEPTVPVATPAATPSIQPTQPGPLPADPDPYANPGFGRDRGFGPRGGDEGGGGFGGGGSAPSTPSTPGGGGAAPAPSTGGNQT